MLPGLSAGPEDVSGSVSDSVPPGSEPEIAEQHRTEHPGDRAAGGLWDQQLFYGTVSGGNALHAIGISQAACAGAFDGRKNVLNYAPFGSSEPGGVFDKTVEILLFGLSVKIALDWFPAGKQKDSILLGAERQRKSIGILTGPAAKFTRMVTSVDKGGRSFYTEHEEPYFAVLGDRIWHRNIPSE